MQIIRKNYKLKLLAIALAIVGWAYVRFASNPIVAAARFDQQVSVPITAVNLPVGYVAHFTERQAVVNVAAKSGAPAIKPDEIKAVLDLSNKETGVYNIPVQLVAPEVAVQSLSPASVTLTIEKIEQRAYSIATHYGGTQPAGIVVGHADVEPQTATVRGPTSLLADVSAVRVDVQVPSQPGTVDEMVRPIPVNLRGSEVTGLTVAPNLVRVTIGFMPGAGSAK